MKVYIFLVSLILCSMKMSHAYDLNVCKSTAEFTPAEGMCDNNGLLQGRGKAYFNNVFIDGEFLNGQPVGLHQLHFLTIKAKSVLDMGQQLRVGNTAFSARGINCSIQYDNGKISNKEIICKNKKAIYKVTPFDGKVRFELTRDGWTYLSADLPTLEVTDKIETIIVDGDATLKATAESVKIGVFSQLDSGSLRAESVAVTIEFPAFGIDRERVSLKGTFKLVSKAGSTKLDTYELDIYKLGKQLDEKYLLFYQVGDIQYWFVPFNTSIGDRNGDVYYFKSSNGIEFDGSPSMCSLNGEWGKTAIGAKLIETTKSAGRKAPRWDIAPICGKVTTADGKSFTGRFDRVGRPIPN